MNKKLLCYVGSAYEEINVMQSEKQQQTLN